MGYKKHLRLTIMKKLLALVVAGAFAATVVDQVP
jgi:hypothetical protein